MKILYLSRARIPSRKAHVTHIHKMCDALMDQGVSVELIHPFRRRVFHPSTTSVKKYYDLDHEISTTTLPSLDLPGVSRISTRLWFWTYTIPYIFFAVLYLFYRYLSCREELVVYARDHLTVMVLLFLRSLLSVPVFMDLHDLPASFTNSRKALLKRATGYVVNGPGIRKALIDQGFDQSRVLEAPNGVDLSQFEGLPPPDILREQRELPHEAFIAGFTGNPYSYNGIETILECARNMREVTFVCVGGRSKDLEPMKTFRENHQLDNLILVEHQPQARIPGYLKSFDCLLLPLTDEIERTVRFATPMKLFEYLAAGKPIVASDLPSVRSLVEDQRTALLASPGNAESFQEAIHRIREDPDLSRTLGKRARALSHQYTWDGRAERVLSFLRERMDKGRSETTAGQTG